MVKERKPRYRGQASTMNRYAVKVRATSSTEVIVECKDEGEAKDKAKKLVGIMRNGFVWGIEGVKVLGVRPYLWDPVDEVGTDDE